MRARITDHAFAALAGAAALLFAADAIFVHQIHGLRQQNEGLERTVVTDLGRLRQTAATANDEHHDSIEALAAELVAARYQALEAAGSARTEAQRYAQQLASRLVRSRRQEQKWVQEELLSIRTLTRAANEATRRLERQLQDARSFALSARTANGRAGVDTRVLSSDARALRAAARQRDDLAAMQARAARAIFEFDLKKPGEPTEIAGVSLLLRGADPARNRYSLAIITGSRRIEANDRQANEPVQLYRSGERRPLELVVNQIGKNEIRGFIAAPRTPEAARSYSSGSAEIASFPVR
jgi:hypothetical protein